MVNAAGYLDAVFCFGWFIVGAYLAWPDEQIDPAWQRFGYGVLCLVLLRVIVFAVGD